MNDQKKAERLAALLGMEAPTLDPGKIYDRETDSREAEAVLAYVKDPQRFVKKLCKLCDGTFMVDRANVSYCSDRCRAKALDNIGIGWDRTKNPAERWDFQEPLTIPPQIVEPLEILVVSLPPVEVDEVVLENPDSENLDGLVAQFL